MKHRRPRPLIALAALFVGGSLATQAPQEQSPQEEGRILTVRGTVLDDRLQPLADVRIGSAPHDGDLAAALAQPIARTARDGRFSVELSLQKNESIELAFGGDRLATMACSLWSSAEAIDLGTFAIPAGQVVAGRVRDGEGAPIVGATIEATDLLDSRQFLREQRQGLRVHCTARATSGPGGIFRLHNVPLSAVTLRASKEGCYDAVLQPIAVGDPLDVTLHVAPKVTGRVVDAEGKGFADAWVAVGKARTRSRADGRFELPLRERDAKQITAYTRIDGTYVSASTALATSGPPVELRLAAGSGQEVAPVRVTARTAAGERLQEFRAFASWNPANQLQYRPDALLLAHVTRFGPEWKGSASEGTATLRGMSRDGDTVLVYVLAAGHGLGRVELDASAAADPIEVELPPECIVRGRVLDSATGEPIAGAEVIPTQRLTDAGRNHYASGFNDIASLLGAPIATRANADGTYELRGLRPGATDVFVHVPGRARVPPLQLDLEAGATKAGVDLQLPPNVRLRGRIAGPLPAGAQVRVHWQRNMWSGAWASEFDGAVDVAADGSFAIDDLPPTPYLVQLIAPVPPRGGHRQKLVLGEWNGATATDEVPTFAATTVTFTGKVGGEVPWSRLAVAALPDNDDFHNSSDFEVNGPVALVGPDRSFSVTGAPGKCHLLLFDVLTGVAFELTRPTTDARVDFAGRAIGLVVTVEATAERPAGSAATLQYEPDDDHWPAGVGDIEPRRGGREPSHDGMLTDLRVGDTIPLWLPARTGTLKLGCRGAVRTVDLAETTTDVLRLTVPQ